MTFAAEIVVLGILAGAASAAAAVAAGLLVGNRALRQRAADLAIDLANGRQRAADARREADDRLAAVLEDSRRADRRLRAVLNSIPGLAWIEDVDGRYVAVNDALAAVIGAPHGHAIIGGTGRDFLPRELAGIPGDDDLRVQEGKGLGPDGSTHWANTVRAPVLDQDGSVIGVVGITRDVTAHKAAEEAERAATQRLETMIANLRGNVFRMRYPAGGQKQLLFLNATETQRTGGSAEDYIRQSPEEFVASFHPDDRETVFVDVERQLREHGSAEVRFRILATDGSIRWFVAREKVVERQGDDLISEGILIDVTEEVRARQELEEREREQRRMHEQLAEARRLEALGQLAGGVAHEFNNLIGAILGYARFIKEDTTVDAGSHGYAERILSTGQRGRRLVERLLTFARKHEMSPTRFDLSDVVRSLDAGLLAGVDPAVRVEIDVARSERTVSADFGQLRHVLSSLWDNGRHAVGDGPGTLTLVACPTECDRDAVRRLTRRSATEAAAIETWTDGSGGAWASFGHIAPGSLHVSLIVSDSGVGMDASVLERAFAPFFSTRTAKHGTGLGLATVHGIVLAHDGAVIVESRPGAGTRFEVILPLAGPPRRIQPESPC